MSIYFGNLYFNSEDGRLEGIEHNGVKYAVGGDIWSVEQKCDGKKSILTPSAATKFSYEIEPDLLRLLWENRTFFAEVTITLKDGFTRWNISLESFDDEKKINKVIFPIIGKMEAINEKNEDSVLVLPYQNGWLIKNPADGLLQNGPDTMELPFYIGRGGKKYEVEYPAAMNFQFTAFYVKNDVGCYFATEDSEANIKTYSYNLDGDDDFTFQIINYPEGMGKTLSYCMPYDFVMKTYTGDWQTAVNIYRNWAIKQKWCRNTLREAGVNPQIEKTDLWRINHEHYALGTRTEEYLETGKIIKERTDCELGLHWYGWNMGKHDVNYPEYISRERYAEGWGEKLKDWNEKFDKESIVKIPYVNARLWDRYCPSWAEDSADRSAIKGEDGKIIVEPWNADRLTPMCPATMQWQKKVEDFCGRYANDEGFDGLYLDQIASFNATLCFDEKHPHSVGGGSWWNENYHNMVNAVRKRIGTERFLTTESCCETYIDVFDMFLILDTDISPYRFYNEVLKEKNTEAIPIFNMVYGNHALSYGSVCKITDSLDVFEYKFVRNMLWGLLPTIEGFEMSQILDPSAQGYFDVIKRTTDFFKNDKQKFIYGRLCEIPEVECSDKVLSWQKDDELIEFELPGVIATVWEDENERREVILYNSLKNDETVIVKSKSILVPAKSFATFEI